MAIHHVRLTGLSNPCHLCLMLLHSGVVGRRSGTVAHVDLLVGRSRGRSTTIDGVLVLLLLMMMLKLLCMLRRMVRRRLHLLLQL